ncbi:SDR family NAD(P)-dependent oxidoreductase [Sphingomonas sp. R86520]|uniref:SDR family NAD(P)-dependent oxidoreductase n=1 Tax=Sphingomonas sp. R86520 TaxID=3093859 RepID=UPI0036D376A8
MPTTSPRLHGKAGSSVRRDKRVAPAGQEEIHGAMRPGALYGMKYQIPAMLEAGGGAIVNMASILGAVAWAGNAAYVTSKHAMIGMTKTAALDYASQGIRINAVGPAFVDTPALLKDMSEDERAALAGLHALNRLARPEEIAGFTSFLLSDRASFMTGTYYPVDGGYLAR